MSASVYQPLVAPHSEHMPVRGVDYHLMHWGARTGRPILLLHGWMDCAASFQFMVDASPQLREGNYLIAPDWRGFGMSGWSAEGYWFPDYLADLDALVRYYGRGEPVVLVGHSMGGIVAGLYAGIRPDLVSHYVSLEGFGLPATVPEQAPERYGRWLNEVQGDQQGRLFERLDEIAKRLSSNNPRLSPDRATWLAAYQGIEDERGARYRADPRHRWVNPVLYRLEEAKACWRNITAKSLWLAGDEGKLLDWLRESPDAFALRKQCIRKLQYEAIPGLGHNLHHDDPTGIAERIVAFLNNAS